MISFANGQWLETDKVSINVVDDWLGTIRGYRIFTAALTLNGQTVFRLDDHLDRLFTSAKKIAMPIKYTKSEVKELVLEVLSRNQNQPNLQLEIIFTGGANGKTSVSMAPTGSALLYILTFPHKSPSDKFYQEGINLATFEYQRPWPEVKLMHYLGAIIAHQTILPTTGADEILFIDPQDKQTILEGTTFNFFIINQSGELVTPPLNGQILAGITRRTVLETAQELAIPILEQPLLLSDLATAKEAFLTSTLRIVLPVRRVNDYHFSVDKTGLTHKLLNTIKAKMLAN